MRCDYYQRVEHFGLVLAIRVQRSALRCYHITLGGRNAFALYLRSECAELLRCCDRYVYVRPERFYTLPLQQRGEMLCVSIVIRYYNKAKALT